MASVFTFAGSAVALVPVAEKSGKDHFQDVAKGTGKVLYLNLEMRAFHVLTIWTGTHTKEAHAGAIITYTKIFHPHEPPVIYSFHCSREYKKLARYIIRFHGKNGLI